MPSLLKTKTMQISKMDYSKITDVAVCAEGDYPEFDGSYIESAKYDGRELNEDELNDLTDSHFMSSKAYESQVNKYA